MLNAFDPSDPNYEWKPKVSTHPHAEPKSKEDEMLEDLLGHTPEMQRILRMVKKVAPSQSTILITGESGSGKEFFSKIIHQLSKRANEPFVAVNCGAIPENIVESELFGAKKGSFTGAIADKKGLFEEADGGTLFLDEIGELPLAAQVKLLRFLESREIRRIGENDLRFVDVRIIAATNRNLTDEIQAGRFREDLFYRLNTFQLHLPPLRARKAGLAQLIHFFVLKYNQENQKNIQIIEPTAQYALSEYSYPGNIRELSNIIEHAVVLSDGHAIYLEDLPDRLQKLLQVQEPLLIPSSTNASPRLDLEELHLHEDQIVSLEEIEKRHILKALRHFNGNQTETSKALGISRSTLWRKIQEHKIHF